MTSEPPSAPLPRDAAEMGRWHAEANPGHYRQLALYLQVLRQVLQGSVDQAVFQIATQIHPGRYAALSPARRAALHERLSELVRRCASLLTVEQVAALAAHHELQRLERQRQRNRQLVQRLIGAVRPRDGGQPDDALGLAADPSATLDPDEEGGPPDSSIGGDAGLPPGSVSLGMDLPLRPDRFSWFPEAGEALAAGFDDGEAERFEAFGLDEHDPEDLLNDGPFDADRFPPTGDLDDSDWEAQDDGEQEPDEQGDQDDLDENPEQGRSSGHGRPASSVRPGDPEDRRDPLDRPRLADAGITAQLSAWLWSGGDGREVGGSEGGGPADGPPPSPIEPPSAGAGSWIHGDADPGLLPRNPLQLEAWLRAYDQALSRRLRHLSHAINAALMRCGLLPVLLPSSLLDAVLEGRIETLGAAPNLLRLQLPMALPGAEEPLQPTVVLLRCADLELEQPKLRRVRRELQRRRQEGRRMAQHHRRLQRRLQAREAEALWLQDIRNRQPGSPPPQAPS